MAPHIIFWPFDGEPSAADKARARPVGHIGDFLRVGVLAGQEDAEVRWEGHVMQCPQCRESALSLWERLPEGREAIPFLKEVTCAEARNGLFRFLDQGRNLETGVLYHLLTCDGCSEHFIEPAKTLYRFEIDEESVSAQD
jgi:hypothetical protein